MTDNIADKLAEALEDCIDTMSLRQETNADAYDCSIANANDIIAAYRAANAVSQKCTHHRSYNECELQEGHTGSHRSGGLEWDDGNPHSRFAKAAGPSDDKQLALDSRNLRFYADLFGKYQWCSTDIIHWGVFEKTLNEIAGRIDAIRRERPFRGGETAVTRSVSLSRLWGLLDESGSDDFGRLAPMALVFRTVYDLVEQAERILGEDTSSAPVVDSGGGIRITWQTSDRQVKLVWPAAPDVPAYIYQASPAGNSVQNQNITATTLASKLLWLMNRESAPASHGTGALKKEESQ